MLLSKSKRAPAIAVSSSEGFCLDGELLAILLTAAMIADEQRGSSCLERGTGRERKGEGRGGFLVVVVEEERSTRTQKVGRNYSVLVRAVGGRRLGGSLSGVALGLFGLVGLPC